MTNMVLDDQILNAVEYINVTREGEVKDREREWMESGQEEEPDEDFTWVDNLCEKQPELLLDQTYFTYVNQNRTPIRKGEQAFTCYGSRTNLFLLVSYGFALRGNLFDAEHFDVLLEVDSGKRAFPKLEQMLEPDRKRQSV